MARTVKGTLQLHRFVPVSKSRLHVCRLSAQANDPELVPISEMGSNWKWSSTISTCTGTVLCLLPVWQFPFTTTRTGTRWIGKLSAYYNKNWHPIREEWVEGMKHNKFSMLNSTNNRVEGMNKHLKYVITKYSNIVTFRVLKFMLAAMETECNHRTLQMCQKAPARAVADSELLKYSDLLTPYSLRFVSAELTRSAKQFAVPVLTTTTSCDCDFRRGVMLPCMHMFKLRRTSNVPVFESSLCAERWGKEYFLTDHPVFTNYTSVRLPSVCHAGQLQPRVTP